MDTNLNQNLLIVQNFIFTQKELDELRHLVKTCEIHDNTIPKIYWNLLNNKREYPANFLVYVKNTFDTSTEVSNHNILVGYLSFFLFNDNEIEVSALVHPDYRQQGVFSHLFQYACQNLNHLAISKIIFLIPQKNEMAKRCVQSMGGKLLHFEYHMERHGTELEIISNTNLMIRKANQDDVKIITEIDNKCFNNKYDVMLERFQNAIHDVNREIWLCYLDNIGIIGKIHILFEEDVAYIHNVCVMPIYQKKGYGTVLCKNIINHLIENKNCSKMNLEVTSKNDVALNLYKKCHFHLITTYECWNV